MENIPNLTPVESSNINAIGYGGNNLYIQYKGGSIYKYKGVPKKLHEDLKASESKGKFVSSEVKTKFEYERIK